LLQKIAHINKIKTKIHIYLNVYISPNFRVLEYTFFQASTHIKAKLWGYTVHTVHAEEKEGQCSHLNIDYIQACIPMFTSSHHLHNSNSRWPDRASGSPFLNANFSGSQKIMLTSGIFCQTNHPLSPSW
jgi:hypothetical protein